MTGAGPRVHLAAAVCSTPLSFVTTCKWAAPGRTRDCQVRRWERHEAEAVHVERLAGVLGLKAVGEEGDVGGPAGMLSRTARRCVQAGEALIRKDQAHGVGRIRAEHGGGA